LDVKGEQIEMNIKRQSKYNKLRFNKSTIICLFLIVSAPFDLYALESVRFAIEELCQHIEGNLGGLLMVTAGVGGMISAAFGNMKALYSCIITGIGAFTASALLSLYFPEAYGICSGNGGGGGQGNRAAAKSYSATRVSKINEIDALNGFFRLGTPNQSENYGNDSDFRQAQANDLSGEEAAYESTDRPYADEDLDADLF